MMKIAVSTDFSAASPASVVCDLFMADATKIHENTVEVFKHSYL
jgi:hypothetical protein